MAQDDLNYIRAVVYQTLRRHRILLLTQERKEIFISAGYLGYVKALKKFDVTKGEAFKSYAYCRIRGEVLDEQRRLMGDTRARRRPLMLTGFQGVQFDTMLSDYGKSMERMESDDVFTKINKLNLKLNEEQKQILYYRFEGMGIKEISKKFKRTDSWVSQMCKKIRQQLVTLLPEETLKKIKLRKSPVYKTNKTKEKP